MTAVAVQSSTPGSQLDAALTYVCSAIADGDDTVTVIWNLRNLYGAIHYRVAIGSYLSLDGCAACSDHGEADLLANWCHTAAAKLAARGAGSRDRLIERTFGPDRWWRVLGLAPTATRAEIESAWRAAMRTAHPDRGGSHDQALRLNHARQEGLAQR